MNPMDDQQNPIIEDAAGSSDELPKANPSDGSAAAIPSEDDKAAEYLAGWQRANADYANLKRETERTQADFAKFASAGVITALLPVIDSFQRAHAAYPADDDAAALVKWAEGIGAVKTQFDGIMARAGVKAIDEPGVAFDPTLHEAMMMEPAKDGVPSGTVIKILEPGYKMHDRVLRPAKVVVSE